MPILKPKTPDERAWLKGRNKYCSGFCNNYGKPAQCEGTKPRNTLNHALKTCPMWMVCPCECHHRVDEMFAMTGQERVPIPNPEYDPPLSEFLMPYVPDTLPDHDAVNGSGVTTPPNLEHPLDGHTAPAADALASTRTPTGRAARGGLEAQVWEACTEWRKGALDVLCTPKMIADFIAERYKIPTPSSGAINAVWDRWTKIGFAQQAKKPNRFLGFTGEGSWEELLRIKARTKISKRSADSMARRGFR